MVHVVDPLSEHVGYHILHWIISQYSKVNENLQDNLRSLETGVAVIDDILSPKEEELFDNQQNVERDDERPNEQDEHHVNILNRIINMNINCERRMRNFRGHFQGKQTELFSPVDRWRRNSNLAQRRTLVY